MSFCYRKKILPLLLLSGMSLTLPAADHAPENDTLRTKAAQGEAEAAFYLGSEYFYGENRTQNYTLAAYWFLKAAEKGIPEAQFNYASCLESGRGVKRDLQEAFAWYEKAARSGFEPASFRMAKFYMSGMQDKNGMVQLQPSMTTAVEILGKLAARNYEPAELELAAYLMRRDAAA